MTRQLLDGPRLDPASGKAPSALVVLVHGYGSNGADMIALAPHWRRALPDAAFVAPNGPERCPGVPGGYQWWGLSSLARSALAAGAHRAAPALDAFLDAELERLALDPARLLLVGFSQGTMLALHVGLRRPGQIAGIVGYSGMLADPMLAIPEIAARPPVLLIHGAADPVVPVEGSREANRELHRIGVEATLHIAPGIGHTVDPVGLGLGERFAARLLA